MKFSQLKQQFRPVRFVVAAIACLFVLISNVSPAAAFGASKSAPQSGSDQLNAIERASEKAAKRDPDDLQDVQSRANKGINEIQGDIDADKMKNPGNTKGVTTVEDQVKNLIDKASGN